MIDPQRMTLAEFDIWAQTAPDGFTYELHDGVIYSFATGTEEHGMLCMRMANWLSVGLRLPCRVFQGTISVRRKPERATDVVPDVLVTCEPREPGRTFITGPKLVIEIASSSRSSVANDYERKPRIYEAIESIDEYLIIDSRKIRALLYRRNEVGKLVTDPFLGAGSFDFANMTVELRTVDLQFVLADLYDGILEVSA